MDMVIVSCLAALTVLGDADFIISIPQKNLEVENK